MANHGKLNHIDLVVGKHDFKNEDLAVLFLNQLTYLIKTLSYFDMVGIPARVTYEGIEKANMLATVVDIQCSDERFKKILEDATNRFAAVKKV